MRALWGPPGERRDIFANSSIIPSVEAASAVMGQEQATRIIAVMRCNQILADTVATLPVSAMDVSGESPEALPDPDWLRYPVPEDPTITRVEHFSEAVLSYGLDGNIFTLALPNVFDPAAVYVLDPSKVECRKNQRWRVSLDTGREDVGPDQMIQVSRVRRPGTLRGLSPIDEAALPLGTYRAAQRFGRRVFDNGVYMSGYVALPGPAGKTVKEELQASINEQYGGGNQMKPGIFASGAKWEVPQLSLEALQFLDLQKLSKADVGTLYGIPPVLLGITEQGAVAYASVEMQSIDFEKFTIRPIVERIEVAYSRLLPMPTWNLRFNTNGLLRGDFKTRTEAYHNLVGDKILRPAEVRSAEGYPPDPDMPGYLETPNNNFAAARQVA
jgi:HK97 family phage portal protein